MDACNKCSRCLRLQGKGVLHLGVPREIRGVLVAKGKYYSWIHQRKSGCAGGGTTYYGWGAEGNQRVCGLTVYFSWVYLRKPWGVGGGAC